MKSLKQRREELKRAARKRRLERVQLAAIETVVAPIVGVTGMSAAVIPNLPSTSKAFNVAVESSLEMGDTFLKEFPKVTLSNAEKRILRQDGFSPLRSSNISGVAVEENDLLLRFHSGETYIYPNKAGYYNQFNEALSPGRLLWNTIRLARGYRKI